MGSEEIGTEVSRLVGTGPYRWASYSPARQLVLRRNPYFKAWAPAAQPDGYVDAIVQRFGLSGEAAVTQVERGQADWIADDVPADRLPELLGRFSSQTHVNPLPADWYFALNVNIKPFNQTQGATGRQPGDRPQGDREDLRRPAARDADLPGAAAGLPRLRALLPVDARRRGALVGSRPARARRSSSRSRARRAIASTSWSPTIACRRRSASTFSDVLFKLGFDPRLMPLPDGVQAAFVQNSRNHVEMGLSQWRQQYPAPSDVLDGLLGCGSFVPDSDASPNISGFCDRTTVQPLMQRAVALGLTRPQAAERLWRQVDRHVVDLAVWLPLFNPKRRPTSCRPAWATTAGARSCT